MPLKNISVCVLSLLLVLNPYIKCFMLEDSKLSISKNSFSAIDLKEKRFSRRATHFLCSL